MEYKKVKEIKKALEYNIELSLTYEDGKNLCKVWLADILTLINEKEKEIAKRLQKLTTSQSARLIREVVLDQFAERLKTFFIQNYPIYVIEGFKETKNEIGVHEAVSVIDEILKEFTN